MRTLRLASIRIGLPVGLILGAWMVLASQPASAGSLRIFEASVGQGLVRSIGGPVTNLLVDLDYAPITAEGGKLYGLSEIEIHATGNLVLTSTGYACQATSCLFTPTPFSGGKVLRLSGGNDLLGESFAASNLLTVGLTGSVGYVVVLRGEYVAGTGPGASAGAIRTVDTAIVVDVPEPASAAALAAPLILLAGLARSRAASRTARACARSERAPASRAPRAR